MVLERRICSTVRLSSETVLKPGTLAIRFVVNDIFQPLGQSERFALLHVKTNKGSLFAKALFLGRYWKSSSHGNGRNCARQFRWTFFGR